MNTEPKTIEELIKRLADMEASHKKSISDIQTEFQAYKLATDNRIEQRVAELVADHLNAKGANRPGITRPIFR
jgi:hypothetical protein